VAQAGTCRRDSHGNKQDKRDNKMRRGLYTSNYTGIPAYLMDFGFGGFLGYGKGVSVGLEMEELNIRMRY